MAIVFERIAAPIRAMNGDSARWLLWNEPTFRPTAFVAATVGSLVFNLLARGVSDDKFREMVALPLAIPQSQRGVGASGTPIFFLGRGIWRLTDARNRKRAALRRLTTKLACGFAR